MMRGTPVAWLAAASSLVLAAYLGVDGVRARGHLADLNRQLEEARTAAAAIDAGQAALRDAAETSRSAVAILEAPDVARFELAGLPGLAAGARGRAFWSRTRGMVFSATALPQAPAGRTYQVWVVTHRAAPISAGLLSPDPNGRVDAVFATAPDIPTPVAMTVTLEPAGGAPTPTGPKVMFGTV